MYKLEQVNISNFKSISNIEIILSGESRRFVGVNGAGKSSVIDGIVMGLSGEVSRSNGKKLKKKDYDQLLPEGKTSGDISIKLIETETSKIVLMERKITKNGEKLLTLKYEDGSPVPPSLIENLISDFSINPYNFINLSPQDQAKMVGVDTSEFDKKIKEAKAELSDVRKEKLRLMRIIPTDAPEQVERIEPSTILEKISEIEAHNKRVDDARAYISGRESIVAKNNDRIGENIQEVNRLLKQIEELKRANLELEKENNKELENINSLRERAKDKNLDSYKDKNILIEQLKNIEDNNRKAEVYKGYLKELKELEDSEQEYNKISQRIAEIESQKIDYLQSQSFPKEVSIDDDGGLLINGREIDEISFNHAKVLEIILALLKKDNSQLKTIFIKDGSLYDPETLERLEAMGYQLLIEIVKTEIPKDRVIYIKESKVVDNLDKKTEEQTSLFD